MKPSAALDLSLSSFFNIIFMKAIFLFFSLILLIISCGDSSEDPNMEESQMMEELGCASLEEESLKLVTGIRFFDETASPIGKVGNPNVTNDSPIRIYPNPNNGIMAISKQNDIEYDLFIIFCEKDTLCSGIDFNESLFEYSIDSLYRADSTSIALETQALQIQFQSDFAAGYYKFVFYNKDEDIIVENMYYDASKTPNEIINFLNGEF